MGRLNMEASGRKCNIKKLVKPARRGCCEINRGKQKQKAGWLNSWKKKKKLKAEG